MDFNTPPLTQNSHNSMYQHNLGPEKKNVCSLSVIIAHIWALKVIAKFGVSHFSKFRVAFCNCFAPCSCFASCKCYCCHDPFIVRSSNLSTIHWFHSACTSVSMFTINADNCFCAIGSRSVCSNRFLKPLTRSIIGFIALQLVLECGIHGVNRIPFLQTCNVVVVQKQRLASFQHLRSSSL